MSELNRKLIEDYIRVLDDRNRLPSEKANALVPHQTMLENAIMAELGLAGFEGILHLHADHLASRAAFMILEDATASDQLHAEALARMKEIAASGGNTGFTAKYYLKRKGLL